MLLPALDLGYYFLKAKGCMQVHHVTRQVEYRGDVISLTEALVGFPAGGQVLLSSSTYQRVYGQLHNLKFDERMHGQEQAAGNNAGAVSFC